MDIKYPSLSKIYNSADVLSEGYDDPIPSIGVNIESGILFVSSEILLL